jgi:putative nucleotidyltransferase with HDIG domain
MDISQKLAAAVERMPAFPKSVQSILELTRKMDVDPKQIVQLIEKDPVMTVKILRVINSAFYALPRKVASINHAVIMLGFNTIKNMALGLAAAGMLPSKNDAGFPAAEYLVHSLAVAGACRQLAGKLGGIDAQEAYIAGLLHDFGKIVFAQYFPVEFRSALDLAADGLPLQDAERQTLGTDHTVAGSMLAEQWQFPATLTTAIRDHHAEQPPTEGVALCLFLADQLVKHASVGTAGNNAIASFPAALAGQLGADSWAALDASLPELPSIYNEARMFAQEGLVA